jgi:hypothetical protein
MTKDQTMHSERLALAGAEHETSIKSRESFAVDDGRLVHRSVCSCGWFGWAVFDEDNARRQIERHHDVARQPRRQGA